MLSEERRAKIQELLESDSTVVIAELAQRFRTSEMTIRRDLDELEARGVCQRVHGGAIGLRVLAFQDQHYLRYPARAHSLAREKAAIARAAAAMVKPGEVIAIDSGTTAANLAYALRDHRPLTVITNSLRVMDQLYGTSGVTLISPGGTLSVEEFHQSDGELHFVGPIAVNTLRTFRPSKAFISTSGITVTDGIFNVSLLQAEIRRVLIQIAEEVILISDHTKFGNVSCFRVAGIESVHKIVTNVGAPQQDVESLRAIGIEVILVEPEDESLPLRTSSMPKGKAVGLNSG